MKMKSLFTFALLFVLITVCHAQTTKFAMTLGTDLGLSGKNYKIVTPNVSATYDITPRLSAGVRAEDAITLMKAQRCESLMISFSHLVVRLLMMFVTLCQLLMCRHVLLLDIR